MTSSPEALEALARAYDREDASQRGEPDPWDYDDGNEAERLWRAERIACAQVGLAAYLASSPEGRQEAAALDAADRLQGWLAGTFAYTAYRGRAPDGVPQLRSDIRIVLDASTLIPAKPAVEVVEALQKALQPFADVARRYGQRWLDEREANNLPHDYAKAVFASAEQTGWNVWADAITAIDAALQAPATPDVQTEVEK